MYLWNGSIIDPEPIPLPSSTVTMATQAGPSTSSQNTAQCHDLEDERTRLMDQLHMQELEAEVEALHKRVVCHRAPISEILLSGR